MASCWLVKENPMPELLKNRFNHESLYELALRIRAVYHLFRADDFISGIMDETWDGLGLKARMRQIAIHLGRHLPADYGQALGVIDKVVAGCPSGLNDFTFMCFPDLWKSAGRRSATGSCPWRPWKGILPSLLPSLP